MAVDMSVYNMLFGGPSAFDYFLKGQQARQAYEMNQQKMALAEQLMPLQVQEAQNVLRGQNQVYDQAELMNPLAVRGQELLNDARATQIDQQNYDMETAKLTRPLELQGLRSDNAIKQQNMSINNMKMNNAKQSQLTDSILKISNLAKNGLLIGPEGSQERDDYFESVMPYIKGLPGIKQSGIDFDQMNHKSISDDELKNFVAMGSSLGLGEQQKQEYYSPQQVIDPNTGQPTFAAMTKEGQVKFLTDDQGRPVLPTKTPQQEKFDADKVMKQEKADNARLSGIDKTNNVINAIDRAIELTGTGTTGVTGKLAGGLGFQSRKELMGALDTINANLAFGELQEMRNNSPTGGALGSIAVKELELLKSTIASLDPDMGQEALDKNLKFLRGSMNKVKGLLDGSISVVNTKEDFNNLQTGAIFIDSETGKAGRKK